MNNRVIKRLYDYFHWLVLAQVVRAIVMKCVWARNHAKLTSIHTHTRIYACIVIAGIVDAAYNMLD